MGDATAKKTLQHWIFQQSRGVLGKSTQPVGLLLTADHCSSGMMRARAQTTVLAIGRAHFRQVLYMAAMSASNWSSELAAYGEHFGTRSAVNAKGLPGAVNRRFLLTLIGC